MEPFAGLGIAANSQPAVADLFHHRRHYCVVGGPSGEFSYFEHNPSTGKFRDRTGLAVDPFIGLDAGAQSSPTFVDLDNDGDQDLVSGEFNGELRYFPNLGSALSPVFVPAEGAFNPFGGVDVGLVSRPAFADLDGDGDQDLACGNLAGEVHYFENVGDARMPVFTDDPSANSPLGSIHVASIASPAFGDEDRDGDIDLFLGAANGTVTVHRNTGTPQSPQFSNEPSSDGSGQRLKLETGKANASPTVVDIDFDGDLDVVAGLSDGSLVQFTDDRYLADIAYNFIPEEDDPANEGAELRVTLSSPQMATTPWASPLIRPVRRHFPMTCNAEYRGGVCVSVAGWRAPRRPMFASPRKRPPCRS